MKDKERLIFRISNFRLAGFILLVTLLYTTAVTGRCNDSLDRAQKLYLLGEYDSSISELIGREHSHFSDEESYLLGMNYLKLGEYAQARDYFRKLMKSFKDSELLEEAFVKLGEAYFLEGDYRKAESVYTSILEKYSNRKFKPVLYLRLAQIAAKEGEWDQEKKYIQKIKDEYPYSEERKYADMLAERGYFFTIQVGAFSQKSNAKGVVEELEPRFPAYMVKEKVSGTVLYKVRVGKYQKRREAEEVHSLLVDKGYPARIYP